MPEPKSGVQKGLEILQAINVLNPWIAVALKGISMALDAKRAWLAANPTYWIDVTTLAIYPSKQAGLEAGANVENLQQKLPPSTELIAKLYDSSDALYNEAMANYNRVSGQQ